MIPDWWWQHDGIWFTHGWGWITKHKRHYPIVPADSKYTEWHHQQSVVWSHTEPFTPWIIQNEPNIETRRAMLEVYGYANFLRDVDAVLVDESSYGELWKAPAYKDIHHSLWQVFGQPKDWKNLPPAQFGHNMLFDTLNSLQQEIIAAVQVVNSTPEPDGSYKEYWLRVPPTMKTAREAVAWSFEMDEHEYSPVVQT